MGLSKSSDKGKSGSADVVGSDLAAVLPEDPRPWYTVPHLVKLNLLLVIPLASSAALGYDGSMMNGLQTLPQWRDYFKSPEGALLGALNAVYPAAKIIAMPLVTWCSDRLGRRTTMAVGALFCVVFAIMQAVSQNFATFIASRALLGFFTSFLAQPSPILVTELAYPTHRGKLTALYNTSFYIGGIIAAWCTYGTFKISSTWSWRIPSLLQGALPSIQLLAIYFLPESPRWLVARGRMTEARKIIADCHAGSNPDAPLVQFEMAEIEAAVTTEADTLSQNSWFELFRTPANRRRSLIAIIVGVGAQWNGVNLISYYLFLVLRTIGITEAKDQTLINGLLNVSNWLAAVFIGALLVDRLGRRTLFLISTAGMFCSYLIWTGLTGSFSATHDETTGRTVVGFVFITFFFYAIAWSPLLQAYPVEIFPYTLRSRGLSLTYISTYVGLVLGNQVNPIALQKLEWKYYIVFCVVLAVLFVIIWFLFPETKGHSLEEIREVFERNSTASKLEDPEKAEDEDEKQQEGQVEMRDRP